MQRKEFKSPTREPVKVFGDDISFCTHVHPEWNLLAERYWSAAYAAGCVSKDMVHSGNTLEQAQAQVKNEQLTYTEQLISTMKEFIEEGNPDKLEGSGKPKIKELAKVLGRSPSAQERNAVWNKIQREKR